METTKQVDETARKLRALIDRTDQRWEQLSDEERLEVLREVGELMSERTAQSGRRSIESLRTRDRVLAAAHG